MAVDRDTLQKITTVRDIQEFLTNELDYGRLVDVVRKKQFADGDGTELQLHHSGDIILRIIVVPREGISDRKIKDRFKRHGDGPKELFSVVVRSQEDEGEPLDRHVDLDSEVMFLRTETRRSTESVDIEHDLKYFSVNLQNVEPMYLDYFADLTVGNRTYEQMTTPVSEVFSVKEITRRFYKEFSDIFHDHLQPAVDGIEDDDTLTEYTQLLVNRILFLMFVQKKADGWLDEDKEYLQNKYREVKADGENLYDDFFKPLFFDALNTRGEPDNDRLGKIPYLNGGLFEQREYEEDVTIDNEFFDVLLNPEENEHGDKKGFLLRYKMSLSESNPAEQELVVDPEFIGRIFEMFMQSEERSEKGAFYTPKDITQYMSKNALKHYLLQHYPNREDEIMELAGSHSVPSGLDSEDAQSIKETVNNVQIVDPAVGSGAFIISMMEELIAVTEVLNDVLDESDGRFELKEHIIAHNLYGVDIDPSGIELCKFRTWLHLIQDLDKTLDELLAENEEYALPNLGFKFFIGNSLVGDYEPTKLAASLSGDDSENGIEKTGQGKFQEDRESLQFQSRLTFGDEKTEFTLTDIAGEIGNLREDYIDAHGDEKEEIENRLTQLTAELDKLIDWDNSDFWMQDVAICVPEDEIFKWSVQIPEVMFQGGFDIVIGNPPYKGGSNPDYVSELSSFYEGRKETYVKPVRKMVYDLYQKFIYRGEELASDNGVFTYITSSTFLTIGTKTATRRLLQKNRIKELLVVNPSTFDATVSPAIFCLINSNEAEKNYEMRFIEGSSTPIGSYRDLVSIESDLQENLNQGQISYFDVGNNMGGYLVPVDVYRESIRNSFFEPNEVNIRLYNRFVPTVKELVERWETEIFDVDAQKDNLDVIQEEHASQLSKGDISILGLLTWGGEGLKTNDNQEHIAFLEGTEGGEKIKTRNGEDFQYAEQNDKGYRWIDRVIKEEHTVNPEELGEEEKREGIEDGTDQCWVPIQKGATEEDVYYKPITQYIDWSKGSLQKIRDRRGGRVRDTDYYFREGLFASRGGTGYSKVRYVNNCVVDSSGVVLIPTTSDLTPAKYLLGVLNSQFARYFVHTFINGTVNTQVADMRRIPIVIPTENQKQNMVSHVEEAIDIKKGESDKNLEDVQEDIDNLTEEIYGVSLDD